MKATLTLALCVAALTLVVVVDGRRKDKALRLRAGGKARCQYDRDVVWSQCGSGVSMRTRTLQLLPGGPQHCSPTKEVSKPCRKGKNGKRKGKKNGKVKGCKYGRKSEWSECVPGVDMRKREQRLKPGSREGCPPIHTITKPCRNKGAKKNRRRKLKKKGRGKGCKYQKGLWQACDKVTNLKKRELKLRKGDASVCSAVRTIEKPCHRRAAFMSAKTSKCRYKAQPWSECSSRTNTRSRVLELKSGDPALCHSSKTLTRKCRKPCKFSKGDWSECDPATGLKQHTDHLLKGDPSMCEATRLISKICGKEDKCQYEVGNWSACDEESGMRTRLKTRTSGDPDKCQLEMKKIQRPCLKPNGEEGCFLGTWGEYGPCQNGVMMKHRPVIAGDMECERKAVKTKPCP